MQKEFFEILDELFKYITGKSYNKFATLDTFDAEIRKNADRIVQGFTLSENHPLNSLLRYYDNNAKTNFDKARKIGGLKLVLSASSRFNESHLAAIKKMLLYADTIMIPDPIATWLEVERTEEKYGRILFLKSIFMLLQLKPIVDSKLTSPAIFIFQSFEKILQEKDATTIDGINNLTSNYFSYYMNEIFYSNKEVLEFANNHQERFLNVIEKNKLFVGPGESLDSDLRSSLTSYRDYLGTWRSDEYLKNLQKATDSQLVWLGINERLSPIYHLIENSSELNSQPLLAFDSHWHYYRGCTNMFDDRVDKLGIIEKTNINLLQSFNSENLNWLGNIPFSTLAKLREENANENFRKKIDEYTSYLNSSTYNDINVIVADISRGISSLIAEHNIEAKRIEEKYIRKYIRNISLATVYTLGVTFLPAYAPLLTIATPIGIAGKHIWESINNYIDYKISTKSLMGILASSKK